MKIHFTFCLLLSGCIACFTGCTSMQMEKAYKNGQTSAFEQFFSKWERESVAISDAELSKQPPWVQEAYLIFEQFYNPQDRRILGPISELPPDWESKPVESIYADKQYLIIQDRLKVELVDKIKEEVWIGVKVLIPENDVVETHTIRNFRPRVRYGDSSYLYMSPPRRWPLLRFLGRAGPEVRRFKIPIGPIRSEEERMRRRDYIKHWIYADTFQLGQWDLYSDPWISIMLDSEMKTASLGWGYLSTTGISRLEKKHGVWTVIWDEVQVEF